jgi:class 3 adenylate cyclase
MARVDGLPPRLAERLEREPKLGELGGQDRDVSVLFADLEGFTAYAAEREPSEVIAMLNEYRGIAVPVVVEEHGGVIERFAGDWPRLRAGVNSGPAVVRHVGAAQQRSFSAIGDTTNVAARLQAAARPGEVVIAAATRTALGPDADVQELPPVEAKGKREPLRAFRLEALRER